MQRDYGLILPRWLQSLARISPHAWANTGFNKLMLFGAEFADECHKMGARVTIVELLEHGVQPGRSLLGRTGLAAHRLRQLRQFAGGCLGRSDRDGRALGCTAAGQG